MSTNKYISKVICVILITTFLTSCGLITDQNDNFNPYGFPFDVIFVDDYNDEKPPRLIESINADTAEMFIGLTPNMRQLLSESVVTIDEGYTQSSYSLINIIKDIRDAIDESWSKTDERWSKINISENYICAGEIKKGSVNDIITNQELNFATPDEVLKFAFSTVTKSGEKAIEPRTKIIITEFTSGFENYNEIGDLLKENIIDKNLSAVVLTFANATREIPLFVFIVGYSEDVSVYLDHLANKENVSAYIFSRMEDRSGTVKGAMLRSLIATEAGIGSNELNAAGVLSIWNSGTIYKIYHPTSGIVSIDYENADFSEKGLVPVSAGRSIRRFINQELVVFESKQTTDDQKGSFSWLRKDYGPDLLERKIHASVNFKPYDSSELIELILPENISPAMSEQQKDEIVAKTKILAAQPLAYESGSEESTISGKIKLNIPFKTVTGVNIASYEARVNTSIYSARKGTSSFYTNAEANDGVLRGDIVRYITYNTSGEIQKSVQINEISKSIMANIFADDVTKIKDTYKIVFEIEVSIPIATTSEAGTPIIRDASSSENISGIGTPIVRSISPDDAYPSVGVIQSSWQEARDEHGNLIYEDLMRIFSRLDNIQSKESKFTGTITVYVFPSSKDVQEMAEAATDDAIFNRSYLETSFRN